MNRFKHLLELQNCSYAPYSKYKVSAIAVDENGKEYDGVNIENASYGVGTCAERVAISNAIVNGAKKIKKVFLMCDNIETFGTPCGACRQFMAEFMDDNDEIIIYNKKGESKKYLLKDLLPSCFRKTYFIEE